MRIWAAFIYKLERNKEAVKSLQQAIRLVPDNAEAIALLGKILQRLDLPVPAAEAFTHVLELMPNHAGALAELIHCKQKLAIWADYETHKKQMLQYVQQKKVQLSPFALLLIADDPELHLVGAGQASRDDQYAAPVPFPTPLRQGKKLRVAYISADFRRHATSYLTASFFGHHNREQFEVIGVSLAGDDGSAIRKRVVSGFDRFIEVQDKSPEAISAALRAMEVDIAVDLMGHTRDTRLPIFQCRAAPIQVAFLGYPGTIGAHYMDYIILDPFIGTQRVRDNLTEKPVILPDCYQVNDRERPFPETALSRTEYGLPEDGFIFCAFNNTPKITPDVFDIWMRILTKVENSVLWLHSGQPVVIANLQKEAAARGVAPDRLIFCKLQDFEDHLARYRVAGLFLDTLPYGAHTTASDALWMGCPVLTCAGESFAARVAGSLLHTIGLPELVTDNLRDYEALAIELARQPERLAQIRAKLAARRLTTPLFDTALFTRNIERAYLEMWDLYRSGQAPREIDLSGSTAEA